MFSTRKKSNNSKKSPTELTKDDTTKDLFSTLSASSDYQETNNDAVYWVSLYPL